MNICINNTPLEDHRPDHGLMVKREDLCCPPGPHFSKTRGVFPHAAKRPEKVIGVLDTSHSQGGWAVAQACKVLGKECHLYYPEYKAHKGGALQTQQQEAQKLGATLHPIPAGRSAILYHQAKRYVTNNGGYMFPNALKLPETVDETAAELWQTFTHTNGPLPRVLLISASSGTIAAGLARRWPYTLLVHMGYERSESAVREYINKMAGPNTAQIVVVNEGYAYKDVATPGPTPPWPCNEHYDLKAYRWWMRTGRQQWHEALMWNVG